MEFDDTGDLHENGVSESNKSQKTSEGQTRYADYSMEELKELLSEAIADEDYEKASKVRDEINRKK